MNVLLLWFSGHVEISSLIFFCSCKIEVHYTHTHMKLATGGQINFDPIQEIGPNIGSGRSFNGGCSFTRLPYYDWPQKPNKNIRPFFLGPFPTHMASTVTKLLCNSSAVMKGFTTMQENKLPHFVYPYRRCRTCFSSRGHPCPVWRRCSPTCLVGEATNRQPQLPKNPNLLQRDLAPGDKLWFLLVL